MTRQRRGLRGCLFEIGLILLFLVLGLYIYVTVFDGK